MPENAAVPPIAPDVFAEVWRGEGAPQISVLMPIYQQTRYIQKAIESVLAQRGVVAEIIISDDCSSDSTFGVALQTTLSWLSKYGSNHRVVVRRGAQRLRRDHLTLLVENARCNIVCQAHGDDISHPDRARILVDFFCLLPRATMLASEASFIDATGAIIKWENVVAEKPALHRFSFNEIIEGHDLLIGFCQAWRKHAVSAFTRLDHSTAAVSHDRILAFRSGLTGEAYLIKANLIARRQHRLAWHVLMFDEPDTNGLFGWNLARISALSTMKKDLAHAEEMKLVSGERARELEYIIDGHFWHSFDQLLQGYRMQTSSGRQIAWVDESTLIMLRTKRAILSKMREFALAAKNLLRI